MFDRKGVFIGRLMGTLTGLVRKFPTSLYVKSLKLGEKITCAHPVQISVKYPPPPPWGVHVLQSESIICLCQSFLDGRRAGIAECLQRTLGNKSSLKVLWRSGVKLFTLQLEQSGEQGSVPGRYPPLKVTFIFFLINLKFIKTTI